MFVLVRDVVKKPKKTNITRRSPVAVLARRRSGAGSHKDRRVRGNARSQARREAVESAS
jgi:hypothetical protein